MGTRVTSYWELPSAMACPPFLTSQYLQGWHLLDRVTLGSVLHSEMQDFYSVTVSLGPFSFPTPQYSRSQILTPQHSLPILCFLMGDPTTLCLPSTSMQKTTRMYPNSGAFHKAQSLLLTPWWWLSNCKPVTYLTDQFGPPQPRTLQGSVDLSLLISCTPPVPKPCQLLLYVPLPFDLKSQALHWDLGKRESEKVKLLPGEQKKRACFPPGSLSAAWSDLCESSGKPCC